MPLLSVGETFSEPLNLGHDLEVQDAILLATEEYR